MHRPNVSRSTPLAPASRSPSTPRPATPGPSRSAAPRPATYCATLTSPSPVLNVAFAPDGSTVATANADRTVRLWDPESGEQILTLAGHVGIVAAVAYSPDGSRLASVSGDGTVRVWALDVDDLVDIARARSREPLTDGECRRYLHEERCPAPDGP